MGEFFFPGAALQTFIMSAGGSLPALVKARRVKFKSALILVFWAPFLSVLWINWDVRFISRSFLHFL